MQAAPKHQLLRVLGILFGIAVVIGGTIGQGVLRAPGLVAQGAPDATTIMAIWTLGALIAFIDAMSTVELAASIRESGGPYAFTRRAFGPFTGLAVGITDWLANIASIAFVSVVFAEYFHRLGIGTGLGTGTLAACLPVAVGAVQWSGTRIAGRSQELGSAAKALIFAALVAALMAAPRGAAVISQAPAPALTVAGLLLAVRAVYGTYYGWNSAAYFCEEVRDPARAVTRATFWGIALVAAIYLMVNLAYLHVLSPGEMAGSELVAADAAARVFGPAADTVVTAISLVSLVTIANATVMMFPRVLFAIARDAGTLPKLSAVAPNGTPRAALAVTVVASMLLALVGVYNILLSFSVSLLAAMSVMVNAAAIQMRRREPALDRPYRMPLFPLPAVLALAVNAALTVAFVVEDWRTAAAAFATMAAIVAVLHILLVRARRRSAGEGIAARSPVV